MDGIAFTDAPFIVESTANTTDVSSIDDFYFIDAVASTIDIAGLPTALFTVPTRWNDVHVVGDVIFGEGSRVMGFLGLLGITQLHQGLEEYRFDRSLGPITGNTFIPNVFPNFVDIPTSNGLLTITTTSDLTFTAVLGVPEPSSYALVCSGTLAVVIRVARQRRARH